MSTIPADVAAFLSPYPAHVQLLCLRLREVMGSVGLPLEEKVMSGWKLLGYRVGQRSPRVYFAFVAPRAQDVALGFEYGILLDDPEQRLSGQGSQVRQWNFTSLESLEQALAEPHEPVVAFIRAAARLALERQALRRAGSARP